MHKDRVTGDEKSESESATPRGSAPDILREMSSKVRGKILGGCSDMRGCSVSSNTDGEYRYTTIGSANVCDCSVFSPPNKIVDVSIPPKDESADVIGDSYIDRPISKGDGPCEKVALHRLVSAYFL
jgi:hypothetical protein